MIFGSKKKTEFKSWHAILLVGVLITALILGVLQNTGAEPKNETPIDIILNEQTCTLSGGVWNSCASACRGIDPSIPCIEVCISQCECQQSEDCPFGYECGEFVDEIGICSQDTSI